METSQSDAHEEVKVTFYPELSPNSSLSKPGTPPSSTLDALPSPAYSCKEDDIPNLHLREIHGLDISDEDLVFAMEASAPPERKVEEEDRSEMGMRLRALTAGVQRWESLTSKVWKGGLEVINEEFKDIECIIGMEVYVFRVYLLSLFIQLNSMLELSISHTTFSSHSRRYFSASTIPKIWLSRRLPTLSMPGSLLLMHQRPQERAIRTQRVGQIVSSGIATTNSNGRGKSSKPGARRQQKNGATK